MIIDHIGIVVKSLSDGIEYWKSVFAYEQHTEIVINTRQKVKVAFLKKKDSVMIKLIEPIDELSSVYSFSKRGGGIHHICFKCDILHETILELNKKGLRTLTNPEPGEAFENEDIAFLFSTQNFYIELISTNKKANVLKK